LSDPKVILSILALIVSIFSLIWTCTNQWEQNRRWDALNAGTVELREAKFFTWRELTKTEAFSIEWGYDPLILSSPEIYGRFRLLYCLQPRDPATGSPISKANPVFTLPELENELKRLDINQAVEVVRLFRPVFVFENIGKTEVTDWQVKIDLRLPNSNWQRAFESDTALRIPPTQNINVSFDFAIPLEQPIPDVLSFRISTVFKDIHGQQVLPETTIVSWESQRNYWFFGSEDTTRWPSQTKSMAVKWLPPIRGHTTAKKW
jgi:hypothetical protein